MLFGLLLILYWRRYPGNFNMGSGRQFFENMKRNFDVRRQSSGNQRSSSGGQQPSGYGPTREDDMEYNARKQQRQAEVDAILDKIRKSGYDSLSCNARRIWKEKRDL